AKIRNGEIGQIEQRANQANSGTAPRTISENATENNEENGGSGNEQRVGNEKSEHHRIPACKSSLREPVERLGEPRNQHAEADVSAVWDRCPGRCSGRRPDNERCVNPDVGEPWRLARVE